MIKGQFVNIIHNRCGKTVLVNVTEQKDENTPYDYWAEISSKENRECQCDLTFRETEEIGEKAIEITVKTLGEIY